MRTLIAAAGAAFAAGLALFAPMRARANPVISEFMAQNTSGLRDEDNSTQDWIEIHNPTASPINLAGWHLTDNAAQLNKWAFPSVTIAPGDFLVVFASGKNRTSPGSPLHTNFSLRQEGEYLGLVRPDALTVQQDFGPSYPNQDPDRSFGMIFTRTTLLAEGATATYRVPANAAALPANWNQPGFVPSGWSSGPTGLGFGLTVPGMTITIRSKNTALGLLETIGDAVALLGAPTGSPLIANEFVQVLPTFNILGNGGDGHFGGNTIPPSWAVEDYAVKATGYLSIPAPGGFYTFGINSDDGGRITIDGNIVMDDPTLHGAADHFGTVNLTPGLHSFEAFFWERGGGDEGEFFGMPGSFTSFQAGMRLVGDTANGGLATFTPSPGASTGTAAAIRTNLEPVMKNVNASAFVRMPFSVAAGQNFTSLSLRMKYNDGFAAWIDGTKVTERNAPASLLWNSTATGTPRTDSESLTAQDFNVTAGLPSLTPGSHVLAIQGLNTTAADASFLLLPELAATSGLSGTDPAFFNTPTPGGINSTPSSLGKVADTAFSPRRGFYPDPALVPPVNSVPFPVTITCATPGSTIRYTTDGSSPTETTGTVYTGPVTITGTTVLRALAYKTGWESTNVDTHTYFVLDDVITQSANGAPPAAGWAPAGQGAVNGQWIDYGMDPDIVNHANAAIGGPTVIKNALKAVPTLSLVTDLPNLWDASTGIYVNPGRRGLAWERPCSIELLNDPEGGFQANCGVRIRGGFSRSTDNPKHSFHLYFRGDYGPGKLQYRVFGKNGAEEFNQIDLRTSQNYSWAFSADNNNTMLREEFTRQCQLDMGQPGSRVKYFHLYLNGQYWGLFDFDERPEADHNSTYLGGAKENWDIVKCEQDQGYITGVTDGYLDAWNALFTKANPLVSPAVYTRRALTLTDYYAMQGLEADGVTRTADPVLLDPDNLIDYMLLTFWTGNLDGATSAFLSDTKANNWFGARDRTGTKGFIYYAHDFEHSLFNVDENRTGPFNRTWTDQAGYADERLNFNPMFLHADLMDVPAYKRRFADRVHRHLFNDGALTAAKNLSRFNALDAVVNATITAESARWGDAKDAANPRTRLTWQNARNYVRDTWLPQRTVRVLTHLEQDNLYPSVDGVEYSQWGGYVTSSQQIAMSGPANTTIYYMIDGTDPRRADNTPDPAAVVFLGGTTTDTTLISDGTAGAGATWKYRDPSVDMGASDVVAGHPSYSSTNWKHPQFNDTDALVWKNGDAELGNGDTSDGRPERTPINVGPAGARFPVIYFRKKFNVTNPSQYNSLILEVKRDDGCIVYINGQEVGRSAISGGAIGYTYAGDVVGGADEDTFFLITDPRLTPSVLNNGENTICIQMHNTSAASSDVSFDLRLKARKTTFPQPITLPPGEHRIVARAFNSTTGEWSALSDATFLVDAEPASAANIVISELMYNPPGPSAGEIALGHDDDDFFEYIELQNIGSRAVDLAGVEFTAGIEFDFDNSERPRLLPPGERILVVAKRSAFAARYGSGLPVAGPFANSLDNSGQLITLTAANGSVIKSFTYDDIAPWPLLADGNGGSLVLVKPATNPDHNLAASWRDSISPSPGDTDATVYAAWKASFGQNSDSADTDGDGLNTALEYLLGGTPGANNSALLPLAGRGTYASGAGTEVFQTITFTRRISADDATYLPETSADQIVWNSAGCVLVERTPAGGGLERQVWRSTQPLSSAQREFMRVRGVIAP